MAKRKQSHPGKSETRLPRVKVLLVDDNAEFLRAMANCLSNHSWLDIVAEARTGESALRLIDKVRLDLVISDVQMAPMNGFELTQRIKEQNSGLRVILISVHDQAAYRARANEVKADGFFPKSELIRAIVPAIQQLFLTNG
jgi:DNA-binding NarL/FixJ family response regulator